MNVRTTAATALIAVALLASVNAVSATETEIDLSFTNFEFASDREPGADEEIGDAFSYEGEIGLSNRLVDNLFLDASIERDAILGNTVISALRVREGVLEVAIGPTFGVINTLRAPVRAGIMGSIDLTFFDRLLIETEARETLAVVTQDGDYRSGLLSGSVGLRVDNAIVRFNVDSRRFDERVDAEILGNRRTKYGVSADVFKDGIPYSILLDLDYVTRELRRGDNAENSDLLSSFVLGIDLTADATERIAFSTGADINLFSFGRNALTGTKLSDIPLYRVTAGLSLKLDR